MFVYVSIYVFALSVFLLMLLLYVCLFSGLFLFLCFVCLLFCFACLFVGGGMMFKLASNVPCSGVRTYFDICYMLVLFTIVLTSECKSFVAHRVPKFEYVKSPWRQELWEIFVFFKKKSF